MSRSSFSPFGSGGLSGVQAKLSDTFHNINHGGNMVNGAIYGNVNFPGASDNEEAYTEKYRMKLRGFCISALRQGITNPFDDRSVVASFLRRQGKIKRETSVFDWVTRSTSFKSWKQTRTHSQLLWISGGTGMGKTPLALFLINELETKLDRTEEAVILYYFCDSKNCTRNHAASVIRGLMVLLIEARPAALNILMSDYESQRDSLFNQSALASLWKTFQKMTRDPSVGRVYCIIDGIDQCVEDSLNNLLYQITEFYENEKRDYELRQERNTNPTMEQPQGASLQMILISREAPTCILETLEEFPRIKLEPEAKKAGEPKLTRKKTVKTTKLANLAREALRQERARESMSTPDASAYSNPTGLSPALSRDVISIQKSTVTTSIIPKNDGYSTITVSKSATTTPSTADQLDYAALPAPLSVAPAPIVPIPSDPAAAATVPATIPAVVSLKDSATILPTQIPETTPRTTPQAAEYVFDEVIEEVETYDEEEVEEEMNENQSLAIYIQERVGDLTTERALPENISHALIAGLENLGDGTFLWVDLAIEEIKRYQPQDAELVLQQLPTDVNEIYCRTLASIPPNLVGLVIVMLRWVITARRPLLVQEVGTALSLVNFQALDQRQLTLQGISACGAMLTVDEDDTIHINHNSVQDLLTDKTGLVRTNPALFPFYVDISETDGEIASLCLQYLEQGCLTNGPVTPADGADKYFKHVGQFPLFPYAVEFWPDHLRAASRPQINLTSPFFAKESKIRKSWWHTYWPAKTGKWGTLTPRYFTLLHMASYLNLPFLVSQLAQTGQVQELLEKTDNHGSTPLAYAAEMGHLEIFMMLHSMGAKLEATGETVFELAARKGQDKIVEHLAKNGYPVNKQVVPVGVIRSIGMAGKYFAGALSEGIQTDRDTWRLYTRSTGEQGTALHEAALSGHVSVIEVLLKYNANVRATTTKNWTPLHASSWTGQLECVKLLLERGADANAMTHFGWVPFHCAASRGKTDVVELYLQLGMPVNTVTVKQKTALHLAAYAGMARTVQVLCTNGASVDHQSYKGETALHLATRNFKPEIVELLLSLGANKFVINKDGFTPQDMLRNLKNGGIESQKEMLRILDTFGLPGYVPWKPKEDPNAAAAPVATPEVAIKAHHLPRASTASTFTMPQPHLQPMGQANFNSGFAQPDMKTDPSYGGQQPMHQNQAPMLQVQTTYTYNSQHQTTFNMGQSYGAQLPMTPIQNTGYQAPSQFQNGLSMQVPSASQPAQFSQPVMQMADIKLPSIQPQYAAHDSPPPPPYTAPSKPQAYPQYQSTDEKSVYSSAPTINMQQNFSPLQPSAPQVNPPESYVPPVTAMGAPPRTPSIPNAQELPAFSTASPPSARAAPDPPLSAPTPQYAPQIHGSDAAINYTQPQGFPPSQVGATYSSSPTPVPVPQRMITPTPQPMQPLQPLQPNLQIYQASQQPTQQTYTQHQAAQPSIQVQPPQQQTYQALPVTTQQPVSNIPLQQFSMMSIKPSSTPAPSYAQPLQYPNSPISPLNPSSYGHPQQQQQQYPFPQRQPLQYSQQPQQYGQQQPQPYSPQNPYGQPNQGSGFLSVGVGVGIPSGIFGGRNGAMGSAMAFAPPPTAQNPGMTKKKSFRNLGGFLS